MRAFQAHRERNPVFNFASVSVHEIARNNLRLDVSCYGIEARQASKVLEECKWGVKSLGDIVRGVFYLSRFKRVYVSETNGVPFILPSQITDISPKATKFISLAALEGQNIIENSKAKLGQILLTRSGTVGVCSYVSKTLEGHILSDDIIRIEPAEYSGYVYAYLKSQIGRTLVETNNYGSVVKHIEPEHLNNLPIPSPHYSLKQKIHNLIEQSFLLRDQSNEIMTEAKILLKEALQLPDIQKIHTMAQQLNKERNCLNYSVPFSKVKNRLDSSYYVPVIQIIERYLYKNAKEVAHVGDKRICQAILLLGRFSRNYTQEGNGVIFFGGKQIYELDPSNKKYLSLAHHADRIENELVLHENMTMITCSETIGKVTIAPKHWEGWTANQHIIRAVPANDEIAGYLYAWMSSDYAHPLIVRFSYGAVVDEIDNNQISQVSIPLLKNVAQQKKINDKVLDANKKRTQAYKLEQEALSILNGKVIYAQLNPHKNQQFLHGL